MSASSARLRNPFRLNRTLTICNGIHSRGVYGAVRGLTDKEVREENERYLADRFGGGDFALLFQVPIVNNETASPDLSDPSTSTVRMGAQPGWIEVSGLAPTTPRRSLK